MCAPASMVLSQESEHWLMWSDSHEDIIEYYSLYDSGLYVHPSLLRVEVTPRAWKYEHIGDTDGWSIYYDQTVMPDWWIKDPGAGRARIYAALKKWWQARVIVDKKTVIRVPGDYWIFGDSEVRVTAPGCSVHVFDNVDIDTEVDVRAFLYGHANLATVGGYAGCFDNSTVTMHGQGVCSVEHESTAYLLYGAMCTVCDNGSVFANQARVKAIGGKYIQASRGSTVHMDRFCRAEIDLDESSLAVHDGDNGLFVCGLNVSKQIKRPISME